MGDEKDRALLVDRAHRHLEAAGRPRLVMTAVLAVTTAAGFVASGVLLRLGLDAMSIRYPLAVGVGYATFLGSLGIWLERQRAAALMTDDPEGLFVPGLAALGAAKIAAEDDPDDGKKQRSSWFDGVGDGGDLGEGCGPVLILVLVAAACMLIVGAYLVATSPVLLAELLVDGALLGALSRAISPDPPAHWSRAVLRRTWPAALITAVVLGLVGHGLQAVVPGARTLGEAWAMDRNGR